ncbi:COG4315 family predicted lipoprotein [Streptomyces liangshanensis]|uniref:COG4315 family predicted lipoprotein n=1 Tax=Streptomyces liangshanensis TaxID=2717324 RepID=UPI0036DA7D1D
MTQRRTRVLTAASAVVLLAGAVTACSDSGNSGGSSTPDAAATTAVTAAASAPVAEEAAVHASPSPAPKLTSAKGPLGTILFDQKGRTLYLFLKDKTSKSTCTGACATAWPPFIVTKKPAAGHGVKSDLISTSTRSDGKKQVTYNGHPLYRFDGDQKAGNTNGQGVDAFGAKWWVVGTNGKKITKQATNPTGGY